mmetsp:Transcript_30711/g.47092  ORF Transcript_30711/g.47092 Transcript_30711/m.47092 type:complete len:126 (+) Transcript_30711:37-414(+)|eukprot:CAMPEP_0170488616 /NCGR_PEP_ID=MMETSP0208-20121228/7130_1 /TAXON_ID=197538 /ORGANISM="Strombidium inclinatum, Strain S3" /LENGTH=125 /DNA_ID=CAMNT_0010763245 /DNA_START=1351 /DNA_END=1728 /DNA_ORIENTATION=-
MYPSFDRGMPPMYGARGQRFSDLPDEEDEYGFSTQRSNTRLMQKHKRQSEADQLMNRVNAGVASKADIARLKQLKSILNPPENKEDSEEQSSPNTTNKGDPLTSEYPALEKLPTKRTPKGKGVPT